jgi:hypothetical protein
MPLGKVVKCSFTVMVYLHIIALVRSITPSLRWYQLVTSLHHNVRHAILPNQLGRSPSSCATTAILCALASLRLTHSTDLVCVGISPNGGFLQQLKVSIYPSLFPMASLTYVSRNTNLSTAQAPPYHRLRPVIARLPSDASGQRTMTRKMFGQCSRRSYVTIPDSRRTVRIHARSRRLGNLVLPTTTMSWSSDSACFRTVCVALVIKQLWCFPSPA